MRYELAANGKQYRKNTEQPAASINIFRNGHRQDFLKRYGPRVWKTMTNWKESAGNGKVWMAVW